MLVTAAGAPRHETPNAAMRTLAAPSLGATELAVWEVAMQAGQRGPEHEVDREQVWRVLDGELRIDGGDETVVARAGDAVRVPRDVPRRISAITDARAIVASPAGPTVTTAGGARRPIPWAA